MAVSVKIWRGLQTCQTSVMDLWRENSAWRSSKSHLLHADHYRTAPSCARCACRAHGELGMVSRVVGELDWVFRHSVCWLCWEKSCPPLHFSGSFSATRIFFFHSHNDCNRILFSCSQLLAISNLIHSVRGQSLTLSCPCEDVANPVCAGMKAP